jgi:hypothetical protein
MSNEKQVDVNTFIRELGDLCTRHGVYLEPDFETSTMLVVQDGDNRTLAVEVFAEDREGGGTDYAYLLAYPDR